MADLSSIEKIRLERILDMGNGYVLNFSNNKFREFILDSANKDIYDEKYSLKGDSKANRLRTFWQIESNFVVGKLILSLLEYWKEIKERFEEEIDIKTQALYDECYRIAEKLQQGSIDDHIESIQADAEDKDFSLLAKNIRDSIERNEPEVALDRLHTYVIKYMKKLCDKYGISYDRDKPLHSLFGEYVKYLRKNNLIETDMTEKILKYAISILDAYNFVRNNKSFAHDNSILNYDESMLIFKNISSIIGFIESLEFKMNNTGTDSTKNDNWNNELPF